MKRKEGGKESASFHHYERGEKLSGPKKKNWPQTSFNHHAEMGSALYQNEKEKKIAGK